MTTSKDLDFVSLERIAQSILFLREQRVLLGSNLAAMYGVPTKRFNEQVKRNFARFPTDFAFQLSDAEAESLRSQFATFKKSGRGQHRKDRPYAFTEHGAIMAAMILTGVLKTLNQMQNVPQTRAIGFVELQEKKSK